MTLIMYVSIVYAMDDVYFILLAILPLLIKCFSPHALLTVPALLILLVSTFTSTDTVACTILVAINLFDVNFKQLLGGNPLSHLSFA